MIIMANAVAHSHRPLERGAALQKAVPALFAKGRPVTRASATSLWLLIVTCMLAYGQSAVSSGGRRCLGGVGPCMHAWRLWKASWCYDPALPSRTQVQYPSVTPQVFYTAIKNQTCFQTAECGLNQFCAQPPRSNQRGQCLQCWRCALFPDIYKACPTE
jgi:hypothetical protein